jgi:hypothetical protein
MKIQEVIKIVILFAKIYFWEKIKSKVFFSNFFKNFFFKKNFNSFISQRNPKHACYCV